MTIFLFLLIILRLKKVFGLNKNKLFPKDKKFITFDKTNLNNDQPSCEGGTACACAADWAFNNDECPDVPLHAAAEREEAAATPPQFPFTTDDMSGFRDAEPPLENEQQTTIARLENQMQVAAMHQKQIVEKNKQSLIKGR